MMILDVALVNDKHNRRHKVLISLSVFSKRISLPKSLRLWLKKGKLRFVVYPLCKNKKSNLNYNEIAFLLTLNFHY